jgi:hypothetical protein
LKTSNFFHKCLFKTKVEKRLAETKTFKDLRNFHYREKFP